MRCGLDLRPLQNPLSSTPLRLLLDRTVPQLAEILPREVEIRVLLDPAGPPVTDEVADLLGDRRFRVVDYPEPALRRLAKLRDPVSTERERILLEEIDVLCQFDMALGVPRSTPTVLIVSEFAPILEGDRHPTRHRPTYRAARRAGLVPTTAGYRAGIRWLLEHHLDLGLRRANRVIVTAPRGADLLDEWSAADREDLGRRVRIAVPGPHPLDPGAGPNALDQARLRGLALDRRPFVLFSGASFDGARLDRLIAAFNHLRGLGSDLALVLTGEDLVTVESIVDRIAAREIAESSYRDDIHLFGAIRPELRHRLHTDAVAAAMPGVFTGVVTDHVDARVMGTPVILDDEAGFGSVTSPDRTVVADRWEALAEAIAGRLEQGRRDRTIPAPAEVQARVDRAWREFAGGIVEALVEAAGPT